MIPTTHSSSARPNPSISTTDAADTAAVPGYVVLHEALGSYGGRIQNWRRKLIIVQPATDDRFRRWRVHIAVLLIDNGHVRMAEIPDAQSSGSQTNLVVGNGRDDIALVVIARIIWAGGKRM